MQNPNDFIKKNGIAICLAVTFLAAGGASITLHLKQVRNQEILTSEVADLNSKITAMTNEFGTAKTDLELAKKEPQELKAKIADLSNDLAAFAKQAKSCYDIKNKLKIK